MRKKYLTKSVKLPIKLSDQLDSKLVECGYGPRKKSKWIGEAIKEFLKFPDEEFILEAIEYSDEMENLEKGLCFTYDDEVGRLLSKWVVAIRRKHPLFEGVQSKIIRTAILQKILGSIDTISKL
jgi:hypothetical protein